MSVRSWKGQKIKAGSEISLCIDQITALISRPGQDDCYRLGQIKCGKQHRFVSNHGIYSKPLIFSLIVGMLVQRAHLGVQKVGIKH